MSEQVTAIDSESLRGYCCCVLLSRPGGGLDVPDVRGWVIYAWPRYRRDLEERVGPVFRLKKDADAWYRARGGKASS